MTTVVSPQTHDDVRNKILMALRENPFNQMDPEIPHRQVIPFASYAPWASNAQFHAIYPRICNNTLVDLYRCWELWKLCVDVAPVEGDVLEVGVWKGGTGALLCSAAALNPRTRVYLADTFAGVVKATENDPMYRGGEHADTSEAEVIALLEKIQASNYKILKGIFPDDLGPQDKIEQIKFCHIDVDTYGSAKGVLEYVWPRMVRGGVAVFDDYGFWGCEGVTRYVNGIQMPDARVVHNLNGHAVAIKV